MNSATHKDETIREDFHPSEQSLGAAVVAVAATYVYFLIFAQFGFLKALAAGPAQGSLRSVMAVMGLSGIAASFGLARRFKERRGRGQMMGGFVVAGLAAGLTLVSRRTELFYLCAALTGGGTGIITVGLASMLRREVGGERLGLCLGVGTGAAYAFCNLPVIFGATARGQAVLGVAAACVGLIAVQLFEQRAPRHGGSGFDYERPGQAIWVAAFFVLVWLDSAAFAIIQHTPVLQRATWAVGPGLFLNAGVHLVAAVGAGLLLDRRRVTWVVLAAGGLLIAACLRLDAGSGRHAAEAALYAAGVSLYSTALVFYPARSGRPELAALVYAVAGWAGSALGIGMAQNLNGIPAWFPLLAGVILAGLFGLRRAGRRAPAGTGP